jgi:endonuclease/exonuclease/phosphatase (EEP) superfamily protein YafD
VPVGYRLLSRQMTALVQREFTFPALSSDCSHFTQVDIDHAFYNQNLTAETEVRIPFSGSDHYPIEVQFSAK